VCNAQPSEVAAQYHYFVAVRRSHDGGTLKTQKCALCEKSGREMEQWETSVLDLKCTRLVNLGRFGIRVTDRQIHIPAKQVWKLPHYPLQH